MRQARAENNGLRFGIDLGGTKVELLALNAHGEELWRQREFTPQGDYWGTLYVIRDLVSAAERQLGAKGTVGIGTPGALSKATGRLKNSNSVCLNDRPFLDDLHGHLATLLRDATLRPACHGLNQTEFQVAKNAIRSPTITPAERQPARTAGTIS